MAAMAPRRHGSPGVLGLLFFMLMLHIEGLELEGDECPEKQRQLLQIASEKKQNATQAAAGHWLEVDMGTWPGKGGKMCLTAASETQVKYSKCTPGEKKQMWEMPKGPRRRVIIKTQRYFETTVTPMKIQSVKYPNKCLQKPWKLSDPVTMTPCDGSWEAPLEVEQTYFHQLKMVPGRRDEIGMCLDADTTAGSSKVQFWECKDAGWNEWRNNQIWTWKPAEE